MIGVRAAVKRLPTAVGNAPRLAVARFSATPSGAAAAKDAKPAADAKATPAAKDAKGTEPVAKTEAFQDHIDQAKLDKLAKEMMGLNLSETVAFIEMMQKLLGLGDVRAMVSSMSGPGSAGGAPAGGDKAADKKKEAAAAAPAKSVFELKLDSFEAGDKIKVIKVVREITGLGLKEAKDLVEGAPKTLLKDVTKEQGTQLLEKLKASGAKASLV